MSSLSPGCSPTNTTFAVRRPSPKTVCVAFFQRLHAWQCAAASRHEPRLFVSGRSGYRCPGSGAGVGESVSDTSLDGASLAPDGPRVRVRLVLVAVLTLVGIGTIEAILSNEQLAQLPGHAQPYLTGSGAWLTLASVVLSSAVYVALLARSGGPESIAVSTGVVVGAAAGLVGGTIRAFLVSGYIGEVLARYSLGDFLVLTLAVFVALSVLASLAAGAALTWLSFRGARRPATRRPRS